VRIDILGTAGTERDPWVGPVGKRYTLHTATPSTDLGPLLDRVGGLVRGIVSGGGFLVGADLIERLPQLGVIAVTGAGYDRIDMTAARARGIQVCNAPTATHACVADMAMGLYLAVARRIVFNDRHVRDGRWLQGRPPATHRASGRRLGIWGLGGIGREIARRAEAFRMPIHYHNRHPAQGLPYVYEPSLAALAGAVDVLVCAVPATGETEAAVDALVLSRLGPDGILINVARGSVVDQPALVAALVERRIGGAGLDVLKGEPQVPEALIGLDNVVLSPHTAGATIETWEDVTREVLANLDAFFTTGRVLTPVA
jgi:lactate dehydrogenase-like 2-hydroxyacid dehydrogenase